MGKLKWGTSVSFSCQDPLNSPKASAFRPLLLLPVFAYPLRGHWQPCVTRIITIITSIIIIDNVFVNYHIVIRLLMLIIQKCCLFGRRPGLPQQVGHPHVCEHRLVLLAVGLYYTIYVILVILCYTIIYNVILYTRYYNNHTISRQGSARGGRLRPLRTAGTP